MIISAEERKEEELGTRLHFFLKSCKILTYVKAGLWSREHQLCNCEFFCVFEIFHNLKSFKKKILIPFLTSPPMAKRPSSISWHFSIDYYNSLIYLPGSFLPSFNPSITLRQNKYSKIKIGACYISAYSPLVGLYQLENAIKCWKTNNHKILRCMKQ